MNKVTISAVIASVLIVGFIGYSFYNSSDETADNPSSAQSNLDISAGQDQTNSSAESENQLATKSGFYEEYSPEVVKAAQERGDKTVLFFHASWCPTCKSLDRNITAGNVPQGVTIVKVDYDNEDELIKKYGITYQHTLVQIDTNNEQITKWSGSNTIDEIVEELS